MHADDELFAPAEVAMLSPRLAWMQRHGIITLHLAGDCWLAGFQWWRPDRTDPADFFCRECGENGSSRVGEGLTEDEALAELMTCGDARSRGIRLWNEETT